MTTATPAGLAWVTWRQHRLALAGVLAVLAGLGLLLVISRLQIDTSYDDLGLNHCLKPYAKSDPCDLARRTFTSRFQGSWPNLMQYLSFLPGLIGMFMGAPLLAREFETGTFRLAWTQEAGRTRWLLVKLGLLAVAVALPTQAFSLLFSRWYAHIHQLGLADTPQDAFPIEGVLFAARTVFAFTLGVFIGALVRRTVTAMAATLIVYSIIAIYAAGTLRDHYLTPVAVPEISKSGPELWWVDNWMTDPAGHRLTRPQANHLLNSRPSGQSMINWLSAHHYTRWWSYQPASRFWPLQAIEAGALCTLALILTTAALWWIRHRAA